jgi:hypothetical protein
VNRSHNEISSLEKGSGGSHLDFFPFRGFLIENERICFRVFVIKDRHDFVCAPFQVEDLGGPSSHPLSVGWSYRSIFKFLWFLTILVESQQGNSLNLKRRRLDGVLPRTDNDSLLGRDGHSSIKGDGSIWQELCPGRAEKNQDPDEQSGP